MSMLKGKLVVEGVVSELLAFNLSNLFLSSLISSCIGENVGTSFLFDNADILHNYVIMVGIRNPMGKYGC